MSRRRRPWLGIALGLAVALASAEAPAFVWPNVPERIARGLSSTDPAERRVAAQEITTLPAELAKPLVRQALLDEDNEVRVEVAKAAVKFKLEAGGDLVIGWLSESDSRVRLAACEVIRASPTPRAVAALGRVLSDPNADVRLAAAQAMGRSGSPEAVSLLLGHLDDGSPEVRAEVATALGRLADTRAVLPLVGKVQDTSPEVRRRVARALGDLGDPQATNALVLALADGSLDVRIEAALALGRVGSDQATNALAPLARDGGSVAAGAAPASEPSHALRQAALRSLGRIGTPRALDLLIASLEADRPEALRTPAKDALVTAGPRAIKPLMTLLGGAPSQRAATGAVQALASIGDASSAPAIVRAMQRGAVPVSVALSALATLRSDDALPAVLELVESSSPDVRRDALRAASALLDPARPDGRAVEPVKARLADPDLGVDERVALVEVLGRTGSARAADVLLAMAQSKSPALKRAVVVALGSLSAGSPAIDAALLAALDDDRGALRMEAGIALSRVGTAQTAPVLLDRLGRSAEQDRGALGLALSGVLARAKDATLPARVGAAVGSSPVAARDALIEGLGRSRVAGSVVELTKVAAGPADDRRKVAEALAGHAGGPQVDAARAEASKLASDGDAGVRANAVWSLGFIGDASSANVIVKALRDPDVDVAGNAAGSLGRLAARLGDAGGGAQAALCTALSDPRPYVRANAISGLDVAALACPDKARSTPAAAPPTPAAPPPAAASPGAPPKGAAPVTPPAAPPKGAAPAAPPPATPPKGAAPGTPSAPATSAPAVPTSAVISPIEDLLTSDPSEIVRLAAARYLVRVANASGPKADSARRALKRCVAEERTYRVASRCEHASTPVASTGRSYPVTVFIVPDGADGPVTRAPFALVLPDGTMRLGVADRRGAVFVAAAPDGELELTVPAALALGL